MAHDADWQADLARIDGEVRFFREQSLWAIWVYRFGRRTDRRRSGIRKKLLTKVYWFFFHLVETVTGIRIPKTCQIGPGLRIWHFGSIFFHPSVKLGANCTLRQGVTIGNRWDSDDAPTVGDTVDFGAYAQVLGKITIGDGAKIGAMTLVLIDVPPNCTAVGVPARIIQPRNAVG